MTINVQNITEAGYPLTLTYTTSDYCRYRLLAGGTPIISFSDAGHATRTLAAAHDLRIQTDNDGSQVFRLGEYITSSTYYPLTAITTALHQLADETREDIAEKFTVDPDDYDCDEDNLDDVEPAPGDICTGANDDLFITTPSGQWRLTLSEALSVSQGITAMVHHVLNLPWSAEDPSTILSRGTQTEV